MLLTSALLVVINFNFADNALKSPPNSPKETQIGEFLHHYLKKNQTTGGNTAAFITANRSIFANNIIDYCLRDNGGVSASVVINNCTYGGIELISQHPVAPQSPLIIIFMKSPQDLNATLHLMENCPYWSSKSNIFFAIVEPVDDSEFLENFSTTIWSRKTLNFVVMFLQSKLEVAMYNGFLDKKVIAVNDFEANLFPNKLLDINGFELRVGIFEDPPKITKIGNNWGGVNFELLQWIRAKMNASLKIVETPKSEHFVGLFYNIANETIDFSFNPLILFTTNHYYNGIIQPSYPRELMDLVVIVRKASQISQAGYIFLTFEKRIWFAILTIIILVTFVLKVASLANPKCKRQSVAFYFEETWKCFLGGNHPDLDQQTSFVKFNIVLLMYTCLILIASFQCILTSTLTKPKYFEEINKIEQLKRNNYQVIISDYYAAATPKELKLEDQFDIRLPEETWTVKKIPEKTALVLSYNWAVLAVDADPKIRIMKEPLLTGFEVCYFQKNSPYTDEIRRCMLEDAEFGLSQRQLLNPKKLLQELTMPYLSISHLQGAFYLLVLGSLVAVVVFIFEMTFAYYLQ